jgi:carboxypeptidase C (cathepsin A)
LGEGCYLEDKKIVDLLNDPELRRTLGVEKTGNFSTSNGTVGENFIANLDKWRVHTEEYIVGLLERGIRVLIYAGTYDWQCNWVMNYRMVQSFEWSGATEFKEAKMRDWTVEGKVAGQTKSVGKLTFATIYGAGHLVRLKLIELFLY